MGAIVVDMLGTAVSAVLNWFSVVLDSTGTKSLYLVVMFVVMLVGYILSPLLRSSGSDRADRNRKDDSA